MCDSQFVLFTQLTTISNMDYLQCTHTLFFSCLEYTDEIKKKIPYSQGDVSLTGRIIQ